MKWARGELIPKFAVTGSHVVYSFVCNTETYPMEGKTHFSTFAVVWVCQRLLGTYACVTWLPAQPSSYEEGSHFTVINASCSQLTLLASYISSFSWFFFFLLLLHSCQKGLQLLLLLSVSDATSFLFHHFVIHHTHACALAINPQF